MSHRIEIDTIYRGFRVIAGEHDYYTKLYNATVITDSGTFFHSIVSVRSTERAYKDAIGHIDHFCERNRRILENEIWKIEHGL